MRKVASTMVLASLVSVSVPAVAATYVVDANSSATSLGAVVAGQRYRFSTTGIVDLVGDPVPGRFSVDADGIPVQPVTVPGYEGFNPSGSTTADGQSGPLPGVNFGALIGNFGGATPYFRIGSSLTTTFAQSGEIFGRVNDINTNNSGSFTVSVSAIPEPATWGMLILGFGVMGGAMRRRAKHTMRVTFG